MTDAPPQSTSADAPEPGPGGEPPAGSRDTSLSDGDARSPAPLPTGLLSRWPWLTFCLPLAVFLVVGSLEPRPPHDVVADGRAEDGRAADGSAADGGSAFSLSNLVPYSAYPLVYTVKIALTLAAIVFVLPGLRTFPLRVSPWAIALGAAGAAVWIWLALWRPEAGWLQAIGLGRLTDAGQRSAFNPLAELSTHPVWAYLFLAIRFFGLAAVVPIAEEFFLRGLVMRFFVAESWWRVPIGRMNRAGLVAAVVLPVLMHPGEILAAAVWFSGVAWWTVRTGRIWDCVLIHAVTNLLLGLYVVKTGAWQLM